METEKETCYRPKWMTKLLGCTHKGGISSRQLPTLLTELNPALKNVDENVLNRLIKQNDPDGSGVLDFDTVTKILFQLILKQPSAENNEDELNTIGAAAQTGNWLNADECNCSCSSPGACSAMKITDFVIFPSF